MKAANGRAERGPRDIAPTNQRWRFIGLGHHLDVLRETSLLGHRYKDLASGKFIESKVMLELAHLF